MSQFLEGSTFFEEDRKLTEQPHAAIRPEQPRSSGSELSAKGSSVDVVTFVGSILSTRFFGCSVVEKTQATATEVNTQDQAYMTLN